ncbi:MAG: acyl-CoA thioesterase [Acaryochloridaceae cyanobacterium SU_2_1]|nr:acyl-CoA thioesterase [Acaryochloridaceae cyanobacterium SU_2_1]
MSLTHQPSPWFDYPVRVHPHHTDYAGVVWHGSYLVWMEEARIKMFRDVGLNYADLVKLGCELPVINLSLRYRQAIKMGEVGTVKTRIASLTQVQICCDQHIYCEHHPKPYILGQVTLVPVKLATGRILRQYPEPLQSALTKLLASERRG